MGLVLRCTSMFKKIVHYFAPGSMGSNTSNRELKIMDAGTTVSMKTRYEAAMVLSGVGDAMGYRRGKWEFNYDGRIIHKQLKELGGIDALNINVGDFPVSDDTVMHIATAKGLVGGEENGESKEHLYKRIAEEYIECMKDMDGRGPVPTCMDGVDSLRPEKENGFRIPFNPRGGGCGAAMRAMCIGLRYAHPEQLGDLIAVSVESGRMTHNHPTGYLGALAAALFTAYAIQGKPVIAWGHDLVETLPEALEYIRDVGIDVEENEDSWKYFSKQWEGYLDRREIRNGQSKPYFPEKYGVEERDKFYREISWSGWGGASGHDAPMIAYDALLSYDGSWVDLCERAMLHGGDSDSTGVIAGCCYGAMFGFEGVADRNHANLEYRKILSDLADKLYTLSNPEKIGTVQDVDNKPIAVDQPSNPDKMDKAERKHSNHELVSPVPRGVLEDARVENQQVEMETESGDVNNGNIDLVTPDKPQAPVLRTEIGETAITDTDKTDGQESNETKADVPSPNNQSLSDCNEPQSKEDTPSQIEGVSNTAAGECPEPENDPDSNAEPETTSGDDVTQNIETHTQTGTSPDGTTVFEDTML